MPFFVIFLMIPFIEIAVFMAVGEHIGLFTTLALAFITAIIGGAIIRYQGFQTFFSLQDTMQKGGMPVKEIFDGFCLVAAGATLITPGFVTDTIGFLLLIPAVREILRVFVGKHINVSSMSSSGFSARYRAQDPDIIDGEFEDLSANPNNPDPNDRPRIDKS